MNHSERLLKTLNFEPMEERGAVLETFFPWNLTIQNWIEQGLDQKFDPKRLYPVADDRSRRYFDDRMAEPVYEYEQSLGLDGVKRMAFRIPFKCFEEKVLEDTPAYTIRLCKDGWTRKYHKGRALVEELRPVIVEEEEWPAYKAKIEAEMKRYCTDEKLREIYGKYEEGHKNGDFSIRFRASGFFWTSRDLLGIEEQMYAFYDMPELIHEINDFVLEKYIEYFDKIFDILKPEVILFEEDLSGANGPMISPTMFDEFVGSYYEKLVPFLKKKGVKNVFVDTDGDFRQLIPNFLKTGVDGFLPMDVNAGMDIVKVREEFPNVKFIGAFNKLVIDRGPEAIDQEFERLMPVIRQGGYVPGADHQVAPSASFENYQYYLKKLREAMKQAGADHAERLEYEEET